MAGDEATTGPEMALKLLVATRARLRDLIALKVRRDEDVLMDRAEVAALDTDINNLRELLTERRPCLAAGSCFQSIAQIELFLGWSCRRGESSPPCPSRYRLAGVLGGRARAWSGLACAF